MNGDQPIGELCVLRDESGAGWSVAICRGNVVDREVLARFSDSAKAAEFAVAERDRRRADGVELTIHFPDDCPCYVRRPEEV